MEGVAAIACGSDALEYMGSTGADFKFDFNNNQNTSEAIAVGALYGAPAGCWWRRALSLSRD